MDAIVGEIRIFCGDFAPNGWLFCNGARLQVNAFRNLYAVIKNIYGGDTNSFYVPDLQGRATIGAGTLPGGSEYKVGQVGGTSNVTVRQLISHSHGLLGALDEAKLVDKSDPTNNLPGLLEDKSNYYTESGPTDNVKLSNKTIGFVGSDSPSPFNIMQSFMAMNYIICVDGVMPE